jgi:hypothetical protein
MALRTSIAAGSACVLILAMIACNGDRPSPTAPTSTAPTGPTTTPPAPAAPITYDVAGIVRAVDGPPLAGVSVKPNAAGVSSTTTDAAGAFALREVLQDTLVFQREDYRFATWHRSGHPSNILSQINVRLQPLLTLSMERGVSSTLSNDDLTYSSDGSESSVRYDNDFQGSFWNGTYQCGPCKEIRVRPLINGGTRLHLRWTGAMPLKIWAGEYYNGVTARATAASDQSELTLDEPYALDTVLVGFEFPQSGTAPILSAPVRFELTLEPR